MLADYNSVPQGYARSKLDFDEFWKQIAEHLACVVLSDLKTCFSVAWGNCKGLASVFE